MRTLPPHRAWRRFPRLGVDRPRCCFQLRQAAGFQHHLSRPLLVPMTMTPWAAIIQAAPIASLRRLPEKVSLEP